MGASSISNAIRVGATLGNYEILSLLGKGGMGEVYLARDKRTGRKLALKLLSHDATEDRDRVRRFKQEARSIMELNHPNIVTIYDFGEIESIHFIATEYIRGETLRQQLTRRMPLRDALGIVIQIAIALDSAHEHEIIHRDVKPENVMIRPDNIVKVLDFGLAKLPAKPVGQETWIDGSETARDVVVETEPGTIMGTVAYMSPEQAQGHTVDKRSDIFSLGVVLYEVITGRAPFYAPNIQAILWAISTDTPDPLSKYAPDVPLELQRIVSKALEKKREGRYQTIGEILHELRRLKAWMDFQADRIDQEPNVVDEGVDSNPPNPAKSNPQSTTVRIMPPTTSSAQYILEGIKRHKKTTLTVTVSIIVLLAALFPILNKAKPIGTIAVLPFRTQTAALDTRGITTELITLLSRSQQPSVVDYDAVLPFKETSDYRECKRLLGVGAVVTGSINRTEQGYSISANLVSVENNTVLRSLASDELWKYEDLTIAAQEIAKRITEILQPKVNSADESRIAIDDRYEQGRNELRKRTAVGMQAAIHHFDEVIRQDDNYAKAYAGKADCYNMLAVYSAMNPMQAFPLASDSAERALRIDPNLAEAHTSMGLVKLLWNRDWSTSKMEFERSIALDKKNAVSHQWYSVLLSVTGRPDQAVDQVIQAMQLDSNSSIVKAHLSFVYFFSGRFDEAIEHAQKIVDVDPEFFVAHRYLGWAYEQKGRYKEAIEEFQKALNLSQSPLIKAELAHAYAISGNRAQATQLWDELQFYSNQSYVSPYSKAIVLAAMGQKDEAIEALWKAYDEHADFIIFIRVDPRLKALQTEKGFQDLVLRLKFPTSITRSGPQASLRSPVT